MIYRVASRQAVSLAVCATLAGVTGCFPEPGVAWLPDSSGFVFTDRGFSRLVRYDLKRKARTVIVADTKTVTVWPAVSPDGKRVAVASCVANYKKGSGDVKGTFQVVVYGIDGREQFRGKSHRWNATVGGGLLGSNPAKETKTERFPTYLGWGTADKLVAWPTGDEELARHSISQQSAIYDLKADELRVVEGVPAAVHGRAARPDGKGFLVLSFSSLSFRDWKGRGGPIKIDPYREDWGPQHVATLAHGAWSKKVYRLYQAGKLLEVDTERGKAVEKPVKLELMESRGKLQQAFPFKGGQTWLCLYVIDKDGKRDRLGVPSVPVRLEVQTPGRKNRKVVLKEGEYNLPVSGVFCFFPSPDDKLVAVRFLHNKSKKDVIFVIDARGEIVAEVKPE
jgi:hypothetical protein